MSKTPESGRWQRASPLAILFFFGKVVKLVTQNAWQSLAPLAAFVIAYEGDLVETIVLAGAGLLAVIAGAAVLRYLFFRFQLAPDAVLIRDGVIKKRQLDIKFDRIQGINTQQNVVYRYFGLVTVSFDTAGSAGDEGKLPAVTRDFADLLRQHTGRRRPSAGDEVQTAAAPDALLALDWRDMIRIGLSDKRVLVVLALLGPLFERLGDEADSVIARMLEDGTQELLQFGVFGGTLVIVAAAIGVVAALALISVGAAFWRYHNFELVLDDGTLRSTAGLLTRHEVSMGLGKVQTLRLQQGIILRWFRRFRMTARQARASHKNDSNKNFTIPVVTAGEATDLRHRILGEEGRGLVQIPTSEAFQPISPYYMRSRILINGLGPLLVAAIHYSVAREPLVFLLLLWVPLSVAAILRTWRHAGYLLTGEGLVRRSGMIGYRTVALLYRKVQRVTVTQSPLQRRKGLATLRVYMASGSVKLPYIGDEMAAQLRDYILFKVESSRQAWH